MSKGRAKIRLFVIKEDEGMPDGFEVLRHALFVDGLIAGVNPPEQSEGPFKFSVKELETQDETRLTDDEWIQMEIDNVGFDGIEEDINKVLESYQIDDVVEIYADYCIEGHWSHSYDGPDYEEWSHLENIQHVKLTDAKIKRFIGDFKRGEDGLIEFLDNDSSLNHGIPEQS
jgi:hypothetical protein